jgi:hypothetical protein
MALMIDDKVTWTSTCHSPLSLGRSHYAYDYKMTMNNDVDAWSAITWKTCQLNDSTMIKKWLDVIDMNKDIHRVAYMDYDHMTFHYDYQMTLKWWYNS